MLLRARGGEQARTMGIITNGGGEQELIGVGANAGVLIIQAREAIQIQVSNTGITYVAACGYVKSSSDVKLSVRFYPTSPYICPWHLALRPASLSRKATTVPSPAGLQQ